jgi:hypothetical protein
MWANATQRLPEPALPPHAVEIEDLEVHGEPAG